MSKTLQLIQFFRNTSYSRIRLIMKNINQRSFCRDNIRYYSNTYHSRSFPPQTRFYNHLGLNSSLDQMPCRQYFTIKELGKIAIPYVCVAVRILIPRTEWTINNAWDWINTHKAYPVKCLTISVQYLCYVKCTYSHWFWTSLRAPRVEAGETGLNWILLDIDTNMKRARRHASKSSQP